MSNLRKLVVKVLGGPLAKILAFLAVFGLILGLANFYVYERIAYYLQLEPPYRLYTAWACGLLGFLSLLALPLNRLVPHRIAALVSWMTYPWMGISLLLFTGFLATDLIWLMANLLASLASFELSSGLQKNLGVIALTLTSLISIYALWNASRPARVRPLTVYLKKLPPA